MKIVACIFILLISTLRASALCYDTASGMRVCPPIDDHLGKPQDYVSLNELCENGKVDAEICAKIRKQCSQPEGPLNPDRGVCLSMAGAPNVTADVEFFDENWKLIAKSNIEVIRPSSKIQDEDVVGQQQFDLVGFQKSSEAYLTSHVVGAIILDSTVKTLPNGQHFTCGSLSALNGLGGYTPVKHFIASPNAESLDQDDNPAFPGQWANYCR